MSDESNGLLALKNAWVGAVAASKDVQTMAPAVAALDESTPLGSVDLASYHRVALAQSIAVMALRGLVEQLQKKAAE